MANLLTIGGGSIVVEFPDEPTTGADMEWNFINRDTKENFQILLQAKRISEAGQSWHMHRYKELFYRSGPQKTLQVETLCKTARARSQSTYPAYIFYNLAETCRSAHELGATKLEGINLCDAHTVEWLATTSRSKRLERLNCAVGTLYPFLFSLTDIFCPSNVQPLPPMAFSPPRFSIPMIFTLANGRPSLGRPLPPRPDQVRARLVEQRQKLLEAFGTIKLEFEFPAIPEMSKTLSAELESLIGVIGESVAIRSPIDFWRATFISANPRDELGRPIDRAGR
jgi:hypothetical protein